MIVGLLDRALVCEILVREEFPAVQDTNRAGTITKVSENLKPVLGDTTVLLMLVCQREAKSTENQTFRLLFLFTLHLNKSKGNQTRKLWCSGIGLSIHFLTAVAPF